MYLVACMCRLCRNRAEVGVVQYPSRSSAEAKQTHQKIPSEHVLRYVCDIAK